MHTQQRIRLTQIEDAQIEVIGQRIPVPLTAATCTRTVASGYNPILREHTGGRPSPYVVALDWRSVRGRDLLFSQLGGTDGEYDVTLSAIPEGEVERRPFTLKKLRFSRLGDGDECLSLEPDPSGF